MLLMMNTTKAPGSDRSHRLRNFQKGMSSASCEGEAVGRHCAGLIASPVELANRVGANLPEGDLHDGRVFDIARLPVVGATDDLPADVTSCYPK